jgi:hypothetical protein
MANYAGLILALWDRRKSGGIWNWLAYAQFRLKPVRNLWREWIGIREKAFLYISTASKLDPGTNITKFDN